MEPPIPLLPAQFSGWQRVGDAVRGEDPAQADAENAAILKEDGLQRFATASYSHAPGGGGALKAEAMQFGDATGAYSAYTFYRSKLARAHMMLGAAKLGNQSVEDGTTRLVLEGTSILRMEGAAGAKDLTSLTATLPKVSGRRALAPLLPTYLPAEGLEPATVRYALGSVGYKAMGGALPADVLGFDKSVEIVTAEYQAKGGGKGLLTLLLYPTPQIAGEDGRAIEKALNAQGKDANGTVKMRRVGPLVGLTTGALPAAQAEALIHALHLNSEVTFDQKMPLEFHAEVKKTATLLQNILFFCVVVGGGAVLLGLFLGGARAGIRVLQGKPAHTEPEFLTINLRAQPEALVGPNGGSRKTS